MPDFEEPFEVWCDASGFAIGALLLQNGRHCWYESRKLKGPELNCHPGETELLAVIHALKVWRCYLKGNTDVTVVADHNLLIWLQTQQDLSPKQVRWVGYLQRLPFTWKYIPGRTNVADPLSRSPSLKDAPGRSMIAAMSVTPRTPRGEGDFVESPLLDLEESCTKQYSHDPFSWSQGSDFRERPLFQGNFLVCSTRSRFAEDVFYSGTCFTLFRSLWHCKDLHEAHFKVLLVAWITFLSCYFH